jgi:hypothetical protein
VNGVPLVQDTNRWRSFVKRVIGNERVGSV